MTIQAVNNAKVLYGLNLDRSEVESVDHAVKQVLKDGYRTVDIMSEGMTKVGCKEMGTLIAERI